MRVTRVDVDVAHRPGGEPHFAAAARGSLLLPKDGQWSFVRQPANLNDDCIPADPHSGVPLIRQGIHTLPDSQNTADYLFAEPADLFVPETSGYNVALLWSTGMQRILFSRPFIRKDTRAIRGAFAPLLADFFATAATSAVFPSTASCLEVPFPEYSLNITGDGQLRLEPPSLSFAAKRVSGGPRREILRASSIRTFSDYTSTHFTIMLDSAASPSWSYEQTGVAMVQELDGVHAETSHGIFSASSTRAIRWTLIHEEFGELFEEAKTILPLLKDGIGAPVVGLPGGGLAIPSGNATAPVRTSEDDGPIPKIGLKIDIEISSRHPAVNRQYRGWRRQDHPEPRIRLAGGQSRVTSFGVFSVTALFKFEHEALRREVHNYRTGAKRTAHPGDRLSIRPSRSSVPPTFMAKFEGFIGIGFASKSRPGERRMGLAIIYQASGSFALVPPGTDVELAEVGVNVEGLGIAVPREDGTVVRSATAALPLKSQSRMCDRYRVGDIRSEDLRDSKYERHRWRHLIGK